jgi:starch synthase
MRYGSIPIARRTGGLADTVLDPWEHGEWASGFLFDDYTPEALMAGVETALGAFHVRDWWKRMQRNAMSRDFSWTSAAQQYLEVYRGAILRRGGIPPD